MFTSYLKCLWQFEMINQILFSIAILASKIMKTNVIKVKLVLCYTAFHNHALILSCVINPAHPFLSWWCVFVPPWKPKLTLSRVVACLAQRSVVKWAVVCENTVKPAAASVYMRIYPPVLGAAREDKRATFQQSCLTICIPNKNDIIIHIIF